MGQVNVLLPQVELTMEQATVVRWLVRVGQTVTEGQPLLEVETQKAISEVPSPAAGHVRKLCVAEGDAIVERALLCVLTEGANDPIENSGVGDRVSGVGKDATQSTPSEPRTPTPDTRSEGPVKASPVARRLAKELGVDLEKVRGTGPGGRVTDEDVRAAASAAPAPSVDEWTPLAPSRVALNAQMMRSLATIPQIHLHRRIDVTRLSQKTPGVTFTHRLIRAVAAALRRHPALRTRLKEQKTRICPVSVAVAMETPAGLVAPAIRRADELSLDQIVAAMNDLRERSQRGALKSDELTDAPFAITNLGMFDVDFFDAFVFDGQTAVLSVGRATDDAAGGKTAWFGLALDHRIVDGAEGARFLQTLAAEVARP